ncbi:hypothetical protein Q5O24_01890 [Eubacteriaceae bacterium ES3]|nr:hypothetical protein Q5O24_01890 [Eubacteriaceae bacterium ES3]
MENLTWSLRTSLDGEKPEIVSDYLLNELGVFVKHEMRMPKKAKLTALTGFRIGYKAIPGTDYRAAPMDRQAILWKKIKRIEEFKDGLIIFGNSEDEIKLLFEEVNRDEISSYISSMRTAHPPIKTADFDAASWLCWQEDDEWTDPFAPLSEMIEEELRTERFLEPEVLAATVLRGDVEMLGTENNSELDRNEKFCHNCGTWLSLDDNFCTECGAKQD